MSNNLVDEQRELNFTQFKKFFLLEFTRQLIRNSATSEVSKMQLTIEKEKENRLIEEKERIQQKIKQREREILIKTKKRNTEEIRSIVHAPIGLIQSQKTPHINPFRKSFKKIRLAIPESRLPVHVQYIQPVPINQEIELGKVNSLIADPKVRVIECYGPDENLVVQGSMGIKKTGIILTSEEINEIIQKFSEETKIPIQEGVFKVVAGRLVFMAIISEIVGSKFIIKKMLSSSLGAPSGMPRRI